MTSGSPLGPPPAEGEAVPEPVPRAQKFGNLKPNQRARGRRDKVKFFDSADWVMKQGENAEPAPEDAGPSVAPYGTFVEVGTDEGASPLTGDGEPEGASPVAGGNAE